MTVAFEFDKDRLFNYTKVNLLKLNINLDLFIGSLSEYVISSVDRDRFYILNDDYMEYIEINSFFYELEERKPVAGEIYVINGCVYYDNEKRDIEFVGTIMEILTFLDVDVEDRYGTSDIYLNSVGVSEDFIEEV